jgi:putative phage-type endonuclease
MIQRTEEWFAARRGKVTASRVIDILPSKSGYTAARKNYMAELLCERLTGVSAESYQNAAMQWGTDTEPMARSVYEAVTGRMVEEVGFVPHPFIEGFGASPDGLTVDDANFERCIEIKCPNTATHLQTLTAGEIDYKYIVQMNVAMMCTEIDICDFISYDPRLPEKLSIFIKRVNPDFKLTQLISDEVHKFLGELDAMEKAMRGMM